MFTVILCVIILLYSMLQSIYVLKNISWVLSMPLTCHPQASYSLQNPVMQLNF